MFPWIPFLTDGGDEDLSQFIQDRIVAGEWWTVSGAIDAVGNTIEYIPANGKTAVIFEAEVKVTSDNAMSTTNNIIVTTTNAITAELKIDTTTKDKMRVGNKVVLGRTSGNALNGGAGYGSDSVVRFQAYGRSLAGNGSKKIETENTSDSGSAYATMSGWLFTT